MSYELAFVASALKEWRKLTPPIRDQFKHKLAKRLEHPHVPSAKLRGLPDCYKIKLRNAGYVVLFQIEDDTTITILAVRHRREDDYH